MKKILFIITLLIAFTAAESNAQFRQNTFLAGAGIGLGTSDKVFPLGGQLEWGVTPKLGIGYIGVGVMGGINFVSGGSNIWLGAHGSYHFDIQSIPQLDLFVGLGLAVTDGASSLGLQGGARYFFSRNLAVFLKGGDGWYRGFIGIDFSL
ncbi:MAG: hypothetical protein SFU91_13865 [Chloroherpetonaceae bacterium]|nr:hypothetical protein [Chloroherpetonaceae bacterium]